MPVRIGDWADSAYFELQTCAEALVWAVDHGAGIANLSWGVDVAQYPDAQEELGPALAYAMHSDVVLVAGPDLKRNVRDTIGDAPLRLALDGVAGAATGQLADCVSDGATVANYGIVSGEPCLVPTSLLLYKQVVIRGYYMGYQRRE